MRARDLAEPTPLVRLDDPISTAMSLIVEGAPGVIVTDADGAFWGVLPPSQVLALVLPRYVRGHPELARTWDEQHADALAARAATTSMREALPEHVADVMIVDADDTVIEIALRICDARTPVVAVVEDGQPIGAITVRHLVEALLPEPESAE